MTFLKHSPIRNLRSKGFKVKHFLQICLLLAICFWLLHLVRNTHEGKKAHEEGTGKQSEVQSERDIIKLGRKGIFLPVQQTTLDRGRQGDDETKGSEGEESKEEESGGGDDEIDGSDQEKSEEESEEVEDLIDEEDREREEDETAEQERVDADNQFENENLSVNQAREGGERSAEAGEELYKDGDAAR